MMPTKQRQEEGHRGEIWDGESMQEEITEIIMNRECVLITRL